MSRPVGPPGTAACGDVHTGGRRHQHSHRGSQFPRRTKMLGQIRNDHPCSRVTSPAEAVEYAEVLLTTSGMTSREALSPWIQSESRVDSE